MNSHSSYILMLLSFNVISEILFTGVLMFEIELEILFKMYFSPAEPSASSSHMQRIISFQLAYRVINHKQQLHFFLFGMAVTLEKRKEKKAHTPCGSFKPSRLHLQGLPLSFLPYNSPLPGTRSYQKLFQAELFFRDAKANSIVHLQPCALRMARSAMKEFVNNHSSKQWVWSRQKQQNQEGLYEIPEFHLFIQKKSNYLISLSKCIIHQRTIDCRK